MNLNAQIRALSSLVQTATVGGYTLPADVTDSYAVWQKLQQVEIPAPRQFEPQDAAHRILEAATAGELFDPIALCRDSLNARDERRVHDEATTALGIAINQAAGTAVTRAADATDRIISEHLRPAFEEVIAKAREVATVLQPHTDTVFQLNLQGIVAATSTKVRAAYLELPALVERYQLIRQARDRASAVGGRVLQRDQAGLFASFSNPLAFHPTWRHPAPIPQMPAPKDPTQRLLWLVSDQAADAKPWLPTVEEQDEAWWAQFGEGLERQRNGRRLGQSVGASAPMTAA